MVVSFEVYGESVLGVATSLVNEETRIETWVRGLHNLRI